MNTIIHAAVVCWGRHLPPQKESELAPKAASQGDTQKAHRTSAKHFGAFGFPALSVPLQPLPGGSCRPAHETESLVRCLSERKEAVFLFKALCQAVSDQKQHHFGGCTALSC